MSAQASTKVELIFLMLDVIPIVPAALVERMHQTFIFCLLISYLSSTIDSIAPGALWLNGDKANNSSRGIARPVPKDHAE